MTPEIRQRLWPYLGGIARANGIQAIAIGGVSDHVHTLLKIPATHSTSKAIQLLKGNSSKWLRATFPQQLAPDFAWQEGYGAFSLGISAAAKTRQYIENQEHHHRVRDFQCELLAFLERHELKFHTDSAD